MTRRTVAETRALNKQIAQGLLSSPPLDPADPLQRILLEGKEQQTSRRQTSKDAAEQKKQRDLEAAIASADARGVTRIERVQHSDGTYSYRPRLGHPYVRHHGEDAVRQEMLSSGEYCEKRIRGNVVLVKR